MVIFGAGASYDSLARLPTDVIQYPDPAGQWRPPLANQLFDPRFGPYIQEFPQMHAVIPELENPIGGVEAVLERFQSEASEHSRRLNQLAAVRYYLQTMLSNCQSRWENQTRGVTNYKALLDRIEHRIRGDKLLVSFNHDTLLEEALTSTVGVKIEKMSDYLSTEYKVVKLHGSINWTHVVREPKFDLSGTEVDVAIRVIDKAPQLDINPTFDLASRNITGRWGDHPIIPALSIPVANKSVYECPEEQQQVLRDSLPNIDKVLVIGWKGGEKRFLDSMTERMNKRVRVLVVSSSEGSASELIIKLQRSLGTGGDADFRAGKRGFSNTITSHEADEFLKTP